MKAMHAGGEVVLDDSLPRHPGDALLVQLAPRVGARVVNGARVVRVRLYLPVDVIVAEGDVMPRRGSEVF